MDLVDKKILSLGQRIYESTIETTQRIVGSVKVFVDRAKDGYIVVDNFVDNKIFGFGRTILNGLRFVISPWRGEVGIISETAEKAFYD